MVRRRGTVTKKATTSTKKTSRATDETCESASPSITKSKQKTVDVIVIDDEDSDTHRNVSSNVLQKQESSSKPHEIHGHDASTTKGSGKVLYYLYMSKL